MRTIGKKVLLAGILLATGTAIGQSTPANKSNKSIAIFDLGVMYNAERSNRIEGESFWLQGGSLDAAFPLYRDLGMAMNVSGVNSSNLGSGQNAFSKVTFVAGPRYSFQGKGFRIFGESLFGGVHGFNAIFPTPLGAKKSADAFALQAGGGLDIDWTRHLAIRLIEADYVRTQLPNGSTNLQNDLKLSAGIVLRLPVYW